jgi:type I restriction enzyme M protein
MNNNEIVQKLWNLCNLLKASGVTYTQYVTELSLLLFLKMAKETGTELRIPDGYRWSDIESKDGIEQFNFYKHLLLKLAESKDKLVAGIYVNAVTHLRQPRHLAQLVADIDAIDWHDKSRDDLGDMYEGLLQKNAGETKSGAGQYFTPRPLIDCMVALMQPQAGEVIQDPASGTGGFLIAADRYIRAQTDDYFELSEAQQKFQEKHAYVGIELVPETRRLALMNCFLHDLGGGVQDVIRLGDTMTREGRELPAANLILTNPPFGSKKGDGLPTRDDLPYPTNNKQLAFLQHIYRSLKPNGRAAVVLPDNVLFEANTGADIRRDLMEKCNLHTILRLPTGIFYAQGVKTNVLFFNKGEKDKGNTKGVWVYDLRANTPMFGKRTPLTREFFKDFEKAFGKKADGSSKRTDQGIEGRFRFFSREEIAARGDSLDISWLKDDSETAAGDLPEPEVLAQEAITELEGAIEDLRNILVELGMEADLV